MNAACDIEKTIKEYLTPYLPTKFTMVEKIQWYKRATEDHHFIFIDNLNGGCIRSKLSAEQMSGKE
jgi:hypothetical protein